MPFVSHRFLPIVSMVMLGGCSFSFHSSSEIGNGPEKVSRAFLERIASDGTSAAYATAAPQMRATVGPNAFHAMVASFGLDKFQSVRFTDSKLTSDGTMQLTGLLYEQSAFAMPVSIRVIAGRSGWQVAALDLHKPAMIRVGEGAAEPGLGIGTKIVTAEELASSCRRTMSPIRVPICAHSVAFQEGASSECLGAQANRMIGISATLANVDQAAGTMNVVCRVTD